MSGKYLKEVHACTKPERMPNQNIGTIWQCDCGEIYELGYYRAIYDIPASWGWRRIAPKQWDAENLTVKPMIYEFNIPDRKKKWWSFK